MISNILKLAMTTIVVIALGSCTKFGKNITVKGRILNPITGEPYSSVKINLLVTQKLQYNGGYNTVKTVYSDDNGNFEISANRLGTVYLSKGNGDYQKDYTLGWDYNGKYYSMLKVDKGKTMNVDYHLVPYGNIKLKINNINCEGGGSMCFRKKWIVNNSDFDYWSSLRVGCYSYDGEPFKLPMGEYIYETKVTRSGVVSYSYDTVFVPKTGIVTLKIDY